VVPPGSLVLGVPGKVVKVLDASTRARILDNAARYVQLAQAHRAGQVPRQHGTE
jgi:carbonic anhydrase/acetyltransferase-like protein (isoleucine patch superfamily)